MAENTKCPCCGDCVYIKDEDKRIENNKLLYKRYNECRDFEIRSFWQNSVFVWTFLGICYTAYGLLISNYFHKDATVVFKRFFPLLSAGVSILGMVLSYLWYRMTKALKANFASYEMAIWEIESFDNFLHCDNDYLIHNYWTTKDKDRISSPTKIVISIGFISIILWGLMLALGVGIGIEYEFQNIYDYVYLHCFSMISSNNVDFDSITILYCLGYVIIVLALISIFICIICKITISLKPKVIASSRYRNKDEDDVFRHIRNALKTTIYNDNFKRIPYFDIAHNKVSFIFKDAERYAEGKKKLTKYFKRDANNEKDEKINLTVSFPYEKIREFYNDSSNTMSEEEVKVYEFISNDKTIKDSSIQISYVTILEDTICATIEGTDYKNDMNKITDVFAKYMESESKYIKYQVSYSLKIK